MVTVLDFDNLPKDFKSTEYFTTNKVTVLELRNVLRFNNLSKNLNITLKKCTPPTKLKGVIYISYTTLMALRRSFKTGNLGKLTKSQQQFLDNLLIMTKQKSGVAKSVILVAQDVDAHAKSYGKGYKYLVTGYSLTSDINNDHTKF